MESIVKDTIMGHLKINNILSMHQYGFIKGRLTVTQFLDFLSDCISHVVKGIPVNATPIRKRMIFSYFLYFFRAVSIFSKLKN